MRILHICSYYFPNIGGIEQVARDCVNSLKENNEQRVLCFNHQKGTVTQEVDGVPVTRVNCILKVSSQSVSLCYKNTLKKIFEEFDPSVVIFHYPNPFLAHYLLKELKKHKECKLYVYWHLDIIKQKFLRIFFHGQNLKIIKRATKLIATSPNYIEKSQYLSLAREKCVVIPNCVNEERMQLTAEDIDFADKIKEQDKGKFILFAIGRHVPYKGMEYLIRASRFLDENYKIYIGGKGPLTEKLKKMADGDGKITFLGRITDNELKSYCLACDVFCFPSITKNEAFGIALAEGMYYGKPALTFTIEGSGVNYVNINGVTGLEVENRNVEQYADAIQKLCGDEQLRTEYGNNARQRVLDNFTYAKFSEKIKQEIKL